MSVRSWNLPLFRVHSLICEKTELRENAENNWLQTEEKSRNGLPFCLCITAFKKHVLVLVDRDSVCFSLGCVDLWILYFRECLKDEPTHDAHTYARLCVSIHLNTSVYICKNTCFYHNPSAPESNWCDEKYTTLMDHMPPGISRCTDTGEDD